MKELPGSQPPQSLPAELNWRRLKVPPGIHGPFILAAEAFGCQTHHPLKRTLPCFTKLPGCTLPCPFCGFPIRHTTYVALIDPKNKKHPRFVVQGGKRTWESLQGIEPGTVVSFGRGNADRDTLLFTPTNELSIQSHKLDLWRVQLPLDFRPYLFHLWQWRELSEHFGLAFYPSIRTLEIEKGIRPLNQDGPARATLQKPE
jgi:hypothetical protein